VIVYSAEPTIEAYETELERMTTALQMENASLAHDNKQLSALIKEYEQTLENIMSSFRHRAVSLPLLYPGISVILNIYYSMTHKSANSPSCELTKQPCSNVKPRLYTGTYNEAQRCPAL
jgi:hypothetical protein